MSNGTAQRTGKSEASVEIKALGFLLLGVLGHGSRSGSHCDSGGETQLSEQGGSALYLPVNLM